MRKILIVVGVLVLLAEAFSIVATYTIPTGYLPNFFTNYLLIIAVTNSSPDFWSILYIYAIPIIIGMILIFLGLKISHREKPTS